MKMIRLTISLIYLLMMITETKSIACISCTNLNNSNCDDPFNLTSTTFSYILNQTYCQKMISINGIIQRSSSDQYCSSFNTIGISSTYCCSDRDYCNKTNQFYQSFTFIVILIILAFFKILF
ncbi:unnamed protein product [Adineta steineri]|uniref:Uncharacterized protein n=1 Tax=Adineta steineri TaxID=433720 RepID=A0A815HZ20_9BILA|nr:unnamed protein product [Adineta steineri]